MVSLFLYSLVSVGYLALFFMAGTLLPKKYLSGSFSLTCLSGFVIYFGIFQLIAFPMKYRRMSLTKLASVWIIVLALLLLFVLLFRRSYIWDCIQGFWKASMSTKVFWILLAMGSVAIACIIGLNTNTLSDVDATYAIGTPASSVYSNTLELMSPYMGKLRKWPEEYYMITTDMIHSAFVSLITKIPSLAERLWSFSVTMILLFEMGLYQFSKQLCEEDKEKQIVFIILANLALVFSFSYSGTSSYIAYRPYEGKSVICYFYTMMILLLSMYIYLEKQQVLAWVGLFFCTIGAVAFANSAVFVIPAMIVFTLVVKLISAKKIRNWFLLLLVMLPAVFWFVIYKMI